MRTIKKVLPIYAVALVLVAVVMLMNARSASASEVATSKKFGIGGMLGAPSGLSMKYYFSPKHALDVGVGVGFWGGAALYTHVDYKFHIMLTQASAFDLPFYFGVGAKLSLWFTDHPHSYWGDNRARDGRLGFGVRVPVGIAFNLNKLPLDIFVEVVPGVGLFPGIGAFVDGAVGVRYYF